MSKFFSLGSYSPKLIVQIKIKLIIQITKLVRKIKKKDLYESYFKYFQKSQ